MSDRIPLNTPNNIPPSPSTNYELQNIEPIKQQLEEVKQITVNNIEKVLERGEKIDLLVDSSEKLQQRSVQFHKSSRNLKRSMCYKKVKCYLFLISLSALAIYILAAMICGNAKLRQC